MQSQRILIWRFLLQLPENRTAFDALASKEIHPSLRNFRQKFPMKSERVARALEKLTSCLIHWSPIFENLDYLPTMIFPFVKLFFGGEIGSGTWGGGNDMMTCFEVVATVVTNWSQRWWDYFPNPPVELLDMLEDLLAYHDRRLLDHFVRCGITSQVRV
jgi:hypothetical protein